MVYRSSAVTIFCLLVCIVFIHTTPVLAANGDYVLAADDTINVKVYQEEDLSITTRIDSSGTIDYPLLGEIKLAGMTLDEAEAYIDKLLRGDYLVNPQVSVTIEKYRSFYIAGAVRKPGYYEYKPGMTARTAIAIAGDFTKLASRRKVYIIRAGDKTYKEEKHDLDVTIGPGDTIRVKESLF